MTLADVQGQPTATATLERALRAGRVHHAYRFEGPDGVGKELAALGLAQALLCDARDPVGCGRCASCERVVTLRSSEPHVPLHPDVVMVARQLYAPEAIAVGSGKPQEKQAISIDQIRTIVVSRAAYPPVEGRARIVIVRRAEEMSVAAANALLKSLEEPHPNHHFVLLTSHPNELLPTIRSRSLPVRFGPLPSAVMRSLLATHGVAEDRIEGLVALAGGSMATALELGDDERIAARDAFTEAILGAVAGRTFEAAVRVAESVSDRAELAQLLGALAVRFAADGRGALGPGGRDDRAALRAARMHEHVVAAVQRVEENNAGPSHVLLELAQELRAVARS